MYYLFNQTFGSNPIKVAEKSFPFAGTRLYEKTRETVWDTLTDVGAASENTGPQRPGGSCNNVCRLAVIQQGYVVGCEALSVRTITVLNGRMSLEKSKQQ